MADNRIIARKENEFSGNYIIGVNAEGETKIFSNASDEHVLSERYSIVARRRTKCEAEKAEKAYKSRNTYFLVISVTIDGTEKLQLRKHVGVLYNAPIGTVGVFKRRRAAKKYMNSLREHVAQKSA